MQKDANLKDSTHNGLERERQKLLLQLKFFEITVKNKLIKCSKLDLCKDM